MYLTKNYSWRIDVTTLELNVIRKCLRGTELTEAEEAVADKLSSTMDSVYKDKTGTHPKQWHNKSDQSD
jgi:hypothetical protein